jgi:DNA repair protein RadC
MGECAANHLIDRARLKDAGLFDTSSRLCDHAGGELVSIDRNPYNRNVLPSAATETDRQRSLLERLIAAVAPNDAEKISNALIAEFASLNRVFAESKEALERVIGPNQPVADLLHAAHSAFVEGLRSDVPKRLLSSTDQRLIDYLVATMGTLAHEALRVIFLSRSKSLLGDEIICTGSVNSITVHPRNIFKRAFELTASSVLIVHNHPSGTVEPSAVDMQFTKTLALLGKSLEIDIDDHIIIAGPKWFSFLRQGLL